MAGVARGVGVKFCEYLKFLPFDWNAVTAISTVIIAVVGLIINRRLRLDQEKSERYALLVEFRQEILKYSSEFFRVTAKAIAESEKDEKNRDVTELLHAAASLSALLDEGRFLFPNYQTNHGIGKKKGPAFEGLRREPLDAILAAYLAMQSVCSKEDAQELRDRAYRELLRANQPFSYEFDPENATSLIIEARRSYLNSVVPLTRPREWLKQFNQLYGQGVGLSENDLDERMERHLDVPKS